MLLGKLERVWKTYKELHEHCSQLNASHYEVKPERDEQVRFVLSVVTLKVVNAETGSSSKFSVMDRIDLQPLVSTHSYISIC